MKLVFGLVGFLAILAGCGYGIHTYASSPSFCSSCHEMQPESVTHTVSAHKQISCVKCHDKPGLNNIITNSGNLLADVNAHFKGIPEHITETKERAISNDNCLQCHKRNELVKATGDLIVNHPGHIKEGIRCITCHEGLDHAKMAERGLNLSKDIDKWNKANAEKLIEAKYVRPNMGTCIDCHDKVNKGQKPWKDMNYVMQPIPQETNSMVEVQVPGLENVSANTKTEQDKKTQNLILQAIGKQKANVKVSMECTTCHKIVKIPVVHKNVDWKVNHGSMALQELDKCLNCHQDSKWVREVPKEDIMSILEMGSQKDKYTPNYELVKEQSRTNKFCSTCHSQQPPSHTQSNDWSTDHAVASVKDSEKEKCYICHDKEKPKTGSKAIKGPAESCQSCHNNF
jgi:nitrate/TMAO reductase-like tetraheme cytochrome c subunit